VIAKGFDSSFWLVLGHAVIPPVVCYGQQQGTQDLKELSRIGTFVVKLCHL
jgi:hypothetical protein